MLHMLEKLRVEVLLDELVVPIDCQKWLIFKDFSYWDVIICIQDAAIAELVAVAWGALLSFIILVSDEFENEGKELGILSDCENPIIVSLEAVPPKVHWIFVVLRRSEVQHEPAAHPYFLIEMPPSSLFIGHHEQGCPEDFHFEPAWKSQEYVS